MLDRNANLGRRGVILGIAAAFALSLSACASLSDQDRQVLESAQQKFTQARYQEALPEYQSIRNRVRDVGGDSEGLVEVHIGRCQLEIGEADKAAEHLQALDGRIAAGLQLSKTLMAQKFVVQGDTYCELARREEPVLLAKGPETFRERQERTAKATQLYEKARGYYDRAAEIDDTSSFAIQLGLGYTYLREGYSMEERGDSGDSPLRQAEGFFSRLDDRGKDPRIPLYKATTQLLLNDRVINSAIYDLFLRSAEQDEFGECHELYRELYLLVQNYRTPADLEPLDQVSRDRVRLALTQLKGYASAGDTQTERWPEWGESRSRVLTHLTTYDEWSRQYNVATQSLEQAELLLRGKEYTTGYKEALDRLDRVAEDFHNDRYRGIRKEAQTGYVKALREDAQSYVTIRNYDTAIECLEQAIEQCDDRWVDNHAGLREECKRLTRTVRALKDFSSKQAQIRNRLAEPNQAGATLALGQLEKDPDVATLKNSEFAKLVEEQLGALRQEINSATTVGEIQTLLARIDRDSMSPRESVEIGSQALQKASTEELPFWEHRAARVVADSLYKLREFQKAVDTIDQIENPDPNDRVLKAICQFELGLTEDAARQFRVIRPDILQDFPYKEVAFKAAGKAFVQQEEYERARWYFEQAPLDETVRDGRLDSYRGLLRKKEKREDTDPEELIDLRRSIAKLDEKDHAICRDLALTLFEKGEANQDEAVALEAYQVFMSYEKIDSAPALKAQQRDQFARLASWFADYAPMKPGANWVYSVNNTDSRAQTVEAEEVGGKYRVAVKGATPPEQIWVLSRDQRRLERRDAQDRLFEEFPIGLKPFQEKQPLRYTYEGTNYIAEIDRVGEEVTVPAGTFYNCIVVKIRAQGESQFDLYYFAPDIGEVKYENRRLSVTHELVSCNLLSAT